MHQSKNCFIAILKYSNLNIIFEIGVYNSQFYLNAFNKYNMYFSPFKGMTTNVFSKQV